MELLILCFEFFKTGLFSIGGGLATLPFLFNISNQYGWFSNAELSDMIAVSESTPGPMGVNMATYAGFSSFGILGAILATLSLILPSIIIICIVSRFLTSFRDNRFVTYGLYGIRPASIGLISSAVYSILLLAVSFQPNIAFSQMINWKVIPLGLIIAGVYYFKRKWHPIVFIALGAVGGVVLSL